MRLKPFVFGTALALATNLAVAQTPPAKPASSKPTATAAASESVSYSATTSTIGTLIADPAAKAVLARHVPDLLQSDRIDQMSGMTLKDMQQAVGQYAPDLLSDKVLAAIDADLAKLSAKR